MDPESNQQIHWKYFLSIKLLYLSLSLMNLTEEPEEPLIEQLQDLKGGLVVVLVRMWMVINVLQFSDPQKMVRN